MQPVMLHAHTHKHRRTVTGFSQGLLQDMEQDSVKLSLLKFDLQLWRRERDLAVKGLQTCRLSICSIVLFTETRRYVSRW